MARGPRRPPRSFQDPRLRDAYRIANDPIDDDSLTDIPGSLPVLRPPRPSIHNAVRSILSEIEDRRRWQPKEAVRPARSSRRWNTPLRLTRIPGAPKGRRDFFKLSPARKAVARNVSLGGLKFRASKYVAICVRRKQRKEVLHALGKAGKGNSRLRRRNQYSNVRC